MLENLSPYIIALLCVSFILFLLLVLYIVNGFRWKKKWYLCQEECERKNGELVGSRRQVREKRKILESLKKAHEERFNRLLGHLHSVASGNSEGSRAWLETEIEEEIRCLEKFHASCFKLTPDIYGHLGTYLCKKERFQNAITFLEHFIETEPKQEHPYIEIGNCYFRLGNYAQAIKSFESALAINDKNPTVLFNLGLTCLKTGDLDRAVESLNKALPQTAQKENALYYLAAAYYGRGEPDRALELLLNFPDGDQVEVRTMFLIGLCYHKKANHRKATQYFDAALEKDQDNLDIRLSRAISLYKCGEHRDALTALEDVIQIDPELADAHYHRGAICFSMKRYQEAINSLREVIRIQPDRSSAYLNLARAYARNNQATPALENLSIALGKDKALRGVVRKDQVFLSLHKYPEFQKLTGPST